MTSLGAPNLRQRQREHTRAAVLEAASEIFSRAGFDAASLADIAAAAGVKKALVQYHFATKEQLWRDTAIYIWDARNSYLRTQLAAGLPGDDLQTMRVGFRALVEFTRERSHWLWFMFHEAAAGGERHQWLIDNCLRDDYQAGEAFVREFQARGLIRDGSPLHLLHLISGALTYNLLVAPSTLQATGLDLGSRHSIDAQVDLLQELLTP